MTPTMTLNQSVSTQILENEKASESTQKKIEKKKKKRKKEKTHSMEIFVIDVWMSSECAPTKEK